MIENIKLRLLGRGKEGRDGLLSNLVVEGRVLLYGDMRGRKREREREGGRERPLCDS